MNQLNVISYWHITEVVAKPYAVEILMVVILSAGVISSALVIFMGVLALQDGGGATAIDVRIYTVFSKL